MPTIATPPHTGLSPRHDRRHHEPRAAVRVRVALHRAALTQSLAEGADPAASPELELRAQQLVAPRERRTLARTLQRTLQEARHPGLAAYRPPLTQRRQILDAEEPLRIMIDRLRDDRPVDAEGMALIERMITDGTWSPLYDVTVPGALRRLAVLATAALEPGA